ncbi:MAG TPA: c-type cytochrome [Blastocatellia bacterium]|nr:c-type cytochrome [Blastocatellia bacterium]
MMSVERILKTAILLPLLVLAFSSDREGSAQTSEKLSDPQFIADGAKLFATNCANAYCHGTGGLGGGAPQLRDRGIQPAYAFKSISNGISGTPMPAFKSMISEEQIWKLVAFIVSDAKSTPSSNPGADAGSSSTRSTPPTRLPEAGSPASSVGDEKAGKALFFDSSRPKNCSACHVFNGEGTAIGPDLSAAAANKSARDLFLSIILSRDVIESRYATIMVLLRSGDKITGVKKEEDAESIKVFDTTELPAVLRTVQKENISKIEFVKDSVMPTDYASSYTIKQLLDIVTFLKSSQTRSRVMLKDLFQ